MPSNPVPLNRLSVGKTVFKKSLLSPYLPSWPRIEKEDALFIVSEVQTLFKSHPGWKKAKSAGKKKENASPSQPDDMSSSVAVGIREVAKSVEKDRAELVLVCESARPLELTSHLLSLLAAKEVPAARIPDLSSSLSPHLGLKSVLALVFLRDSPSSDVSLAVNNMKPRVKEIRTWPRKSLAQEESDASGGGVKRKLGPDETTTLIPTKICVNKTISGKKKKKSSQ